MELRTYLRTLKRNSAVIAGAVLVALVAAAALTLLTRPTYTSTAKVFVAIQNASNATDLSQGTSYAQQIVKSYVDVATTPFVLQGVVKELGLRQASNSLAENVNVSTSDGTVIINISASASTSKLSAQIANAVAKRMSVAVASLSPDDASAPPVKLTLLQSAEVPTSPSSPRLGLNLVLGFIAGLLLAVVAVVIRESLDTRVRTADELSRITTLPLLGTIPFDNDAPRNPLILLKQPKSASAESLRALRTNLKFLGPAGRRSFVVTSSVESEGKSTLVANLGLAVAQTGSRVVVVDADLRRPKLATYFGIDASVGLTDVLIGEMNLQTAIQSTSDPNLFILPTGSLPPNPSEILQSADMAEVLVQLYDSFDTVIIDAPPLLPVTDAAILAAATDGAIVAAASRRVRGPQLKETLARLERAGGRGLGVVFTMTRNRDTDTYTYAYSYDSIPQQGGPAETA